MVRISLLSKVEGFFAVQIVYLCYFSAKVSTSDQKLLFSLCWIIKKSHRVVYERIVLHMIIIKMITRQESIESNRGRPKRHITSKLWKVFTTLGNVHDPLHPWDRTKKSCLCFILSVILSRLGCPHAHIRSILAHFSDNRTWWIPFWLGGPDLITSKTENFF